MAKNKGKTNKKLFSNNASKLKKAMKHMRKTMKKMMTGGKINDVYYFEVKDSDGNGKYNVEKLIPGKTYFIKKDNTEASILLENSTVPVDPEGTA